jgi:hypothetical protein
MGKFLIGLVVGMALGVLAMAANPDLPQELRANLASLTALGMRNAGEAADELGDAAEELAADAKPPAATAPVAPADGPDPSGAR